MYRKTFIGALFALATFPISAQAADNVTLATASTGGSYYPVGVSLSTIITDKLASKKIRMSPITTGGSAENIDLIRTNEAQMAIMMGLYGRDGFSASGTRKGRPPVKNLRAIAALWQNYEQYVVRRSKVISGNISDLGKLGSQFSIGPRNSGTEGTSRLVMNAIGVNPEKSFSVANMKYGAAAEAFQNGRIDGMSATAGVPTPAVSQAYVTVGKGVVILDVTDEQLAKINKAAGGLFTRAIIAAGTYEGQKTDIKTIKQPNFLAASADLSADTVYEITKAMFDNLTTLQGANKAAKAIKLETALDGLPVPLHLGAIRFYKEKGMTIPDRLRP